jgi:hypothetical protein
METISGPVLLIELSTPKHVNLFRSENTVGTQILDVLKIIVIFSLYGDCIDFHWDTVD